MVDARRLKEVMTSLSMRRASVNHSANNNNTQQQQQQQQQPAASDVATRRRLSMSAAQSSDLDCPAFLMNSFQATNTSSRRQSETGNTKIASLRRGVRSSSSSSNNHNHEGTTATAASGSVRNSQSQSIGRHSDSNNNGNSGSSHHRRGRRLHREHHTSTYSNHNHHSSSTQGTHRHSHRGSISTSTTSSSARNLSLQSHLSSSTTSSKGSRMQHHHHHQKPRSSSMSSISSAQRRIEWRLQQEQQETNTPTTASTSDFEPTDTTNGLHKSPRRRRRTTLSTATTTTTVMDQSDTTTTQQSPRRRSSSIQRRSSLSDAHLTPRATTSSVLEYEFDDGNDGAEFGIHRHSNSRRQSHYSQSRHGPNTSTTAVEAIHNNHNYDSDENDVEEFAGDHNDDEQAAAAWPSPFEVDPFAEYDDGLGNNNNNSNNLFAQKQKRQERQKLRYPAAAAASTVLNTRTKTATTNFTRQAPARSASMPVSPVAIQKAGTTESTTTPIISNNNNNLERGLHRKLSLNNNHHQTGKSSASLFGLPLTEPKKEIMFTPSAHRRTLALNLSGHTALMKRSDITLTPVIHGSSSSAHRRSMSSDHSSIARVPLSETAATGSKSLLLRRSQSLVMMNEHGQSLILPLSPLCQGSKSAEGKSVAVGKEGTTALSVESPSTTTRMSDASPSSFSKTSKDRRNNLQVQPSASALETTQVTGSGGKKQTLSADRQSTMFRRSNSMEDRRTIESLLLSPLKSSKSSNLTQSTASSISSDDLINVKSESVNASSQVVVKPVEPGSSFDNKSSALAVSSSTSRRRPPKSGQTSRETTSNRGHHSASADRKPIRKSRSSREGSQAGASVGPSSTTSRIRRRFSHSPSTTMTGDGNGVASSSVAPRFNRRVSMGSGTTGIDGDVSAVVSTLNRMKIRAPSSKSSSAQQMQPQSHMMNW